jgi:hypothetical protein
MRPTLATFAESGPEAAIPLDGSVQSRALWIQTGQMLGMMSRGYAAAQNIGTVLPQFSPQAELSLPSLDEIELTKDLRLNAPFSARTYGQSVPRTRTSAQSLTLSVNPIGSKEGITLQVNYSPIIYADEENSSSLEAKLKANNDELIDRVMAQLRQYREDEERAKYG